MSSILVAWAIRPRTRSTLARMVANRDSVSTYCPVTSSELVVRDTTSPSSASRFIVSSSLSEGTEMVTDPDRSVESPL